jgi:hypothetical protein
MKDLEKFFMTAEAEVKSKILLLIASMLLSLISPIGMWLTASLVMTVNDSNNLTGIFGLAAAILTLLFTIFIASRSLNFWKAYSYRFSEEENRLSNQHDEYIDYIYPSILKKQVIIDTRLLVYTWFMSTSMFTFAFAYPIVKNIMKMAS